LIETQFEQDKNMIVLALGASKKFFGAPLKFELCILGLGQGFQTQILSRVTKAIKNVPRAAHCRKNGSAGHSS